MTSPSIEFSILNKDNLEPWGNWEDPRPKQSSQTKQTGWKFSHFEFGQGLNLAKDGKDQGLKGRIEDCPPKKHTFQKLPNFTLFPPGVWWFLFLLRLLGSPQVFVETSSFKPLENKNLPGPEVCILYNPQSSFI